MTRVLVVAAAVLAAFSQSLVAEELAVHLSVRPMAAPRPALKYQLLPELSELTPGNAAQDYLKCFAEQRPFFFSQQGLDERTQFQRMPLAELALAKGSHYGGGVLNRADFAARMDHLDWQTSETIQNGDIDLLPGEMGPLQTLAASLQVRFRGQVAEHHFDDAVRSAKTMFALSRDLGEHPTLVANLVGLWTAQLGLETLQEMVQQHGCPNLYWALTNLPSPLVDLRKGAQGDQLLVTREFRLVRSNAPMTDAELEKFVSRLSGLISFSREQSGQSPRSFRAALQAMTKDPDKIRIARQRLVEAGSKDDEVKKLPPLQVILLDQNREYEMERDERLKILGLPLWQVDCRAGAVERDRSRDLPQASLLPDVQKLRREQGALEQTIAILRHVEALRMYAAEHGGKLPDKLADIAVPLPLDPVSGKPFDYSVKQKTAHISGVSIRSENQGPPHTVCYTVTIWK